MQFARFSLLRMTHSGCLIDWPRVFDALLPQSWKKKSLHLQYQCIQWPQFKIFSKQDFTDNLQKKRNSLHRKLIHPFNRRALETMISVKYLQSIVFPHLILSDPFFSEVAGASPKLTKVSYSRCFKVTSSSPTWRSLRP